jgi:hypothetical protein
MSAARALYARIARQTAWIAAAHFRASASRQASQQSSPTCSIKIPENAKITFI